MQVVKQIMVHKLEIGNRPQARAIARCLNIYYSIVHVAVKNDVTTYVAMNLTKQQVMDQHCTRAAKPLKLVQGYRSEGPLLDTLPSTLFRPSPFSKTTMSIAPSLLNLPSLDLSDSATTYMLSELPLVLR